MNNENEKLNNLEIKEISENKETVEMTVSESIFAKIKADRISPTSKLHFRVVNSALWLPGILITLLGAFAVAGIIFGETHAGWEYRQFVNNSPLSLIMQALPIIWIILFVVFAGFIVKALRFTSRGYRYETKIILLSSFLISVILGSAIYIIDEQIIENKLLRYPTQRIQTVIWSRPEIGRLLGQINIGEDGSVVLIDATNKNWLLDTSELTSDDPLQDKQMVRIIGQQLTDGGFVACLVFPWEFDRHEMLEAGNEIRSHRNDAPRDASSRCNDILNLLRLQMQ